MGLRGLLCGALFSIFVLSDVSDHASAASVAEPVRTERLCVEQLETSILVDYTRR